MQLNGKRKGVALVCNSDGAILNVLRDDFELTKHHPESFLSIIETDSKMKALGLIQEVEDHRAAFDWELNVIAGGEVKLLYFAGGRTGESDILLVGAAQGTELTTEFYEELMRVNNEQLNALRAALKKQAMLTHEQQAMRAHDQELYEELTRLNNEVMTTQRELAKKQAQLNRERERYRMISDMISDFAFAVRIGEDGDLTLEWSTDALERITGYTADEIVPETAIETIVHPQDRGKAHREWQKVLTAAQSGDAEFRIITKSGELKWLLNYSRPVWDDEENRLIRIVGAAQDITEKKIAEQERERLITELDAFAHTVAHDLKNPLSVVEGFTSLLIDDVDEMDEETIREYLAFTDQSARKAVSIIEELLMLASVRSADIQREPLEDMGSIVEEAQSRMINMIRESGARIETPDVWPVAVGYGAWIEEVWANYISNAIKYGGVPPHIVLGSTRQNEHIRFWVRDNGQGLTPDEMERLFLPFTQLHQNTEGQGLGLSIVHRIIDKLNGQVGVESTPGEGSTFYFTLPAA